MKLFECQVCGNALHFDNTACVSCGSTVAYLPELSRLSVVEAEDGVLRPHVDPHQRYLACANAQHGVCNWLVRAEEGQPLCLACRRNRTVPDLSIPGNAERWARLESAKRHLIYSLIRLGHPPEEGAPGQGALTFDFRADATDSEGVHRPVTTGHANGVITINIAEADDAERERRRIDLDEPYRTLLGHMRHEIGHYFWDRLVDGTPRLARFRELFGDERADYAAALAAYHARGPSPDWQNTCISAYATAHPWEDFAETFAHYLHIVDALETARAFGLSIKPRIGSADRLETEVDLDPYRAPDVDWLLGAWVPLTVAVNSINRSMGQPDLYPFVLSAEVALKLGFIHDLLAARRGAAEPGNHTA